MKAILAIAMLFLSGCVALEDQYWVKTREPVNTPPKVVYVPVPCGNREWNGCWIERTNTIQLKPGLSAAEHKCVMDHELTHAAGYDHDPRWRLAKTDCGNKLN